jgi:hypothetical protein
MACTAVPWRAQPAQIGAEWPYRVVYLGDLVGRRLLYPIRKSSKGIEAGPRAAVTMRLEEITRHKFRTNLTKVASVAAANRESRIALSRHQRVTSQNNPRGLPFGCEISVRPAAPASRARSVWPR